jgi:hypothetical protein
VRDEDFEQRLYPYPRVFLTKSAQRIENVVDTLDCELKRVCKILKTKDCVFGDGGARRWSAGWRWARLRNWAPEKLQWKDSWRD